MSFTRGNDGKHRAEVFERDQQTCQVCGLSIEFLAGWLFPRSSPLRAEALEKYPWAAKAYNINDLWDLDHRIPVIQGGGELGIENLRTCCRGCHKELTKVLAGQRKRLPKKKYQQWLKDKPGK